MTLYGNIDSVSYSNASGNLGPFTLKGGAYAMTVHAGTWGGGSVALQRLAADGATWIGVGLSFTADGFSTANLPVGQYQIAIAAATGVAVDVTSVAASL
jgi:hypothetical protein